jgi:hypothetical protein
MTPSLDTLGRSLDQWQGLYILSITVAVLGTIAIVYFAFHREHKLALRISNYAYVVASLLAVVSTIVIVNKTKALDTEKDRVVKVATHAADLKIAQAEQDASKGIADAAIANQKAAEATKQAAEANSHLAEANKQAAEANKKAAEANSTAQQAVLDKTKILNDNLKLQEQMGQEQGARQQIEKQLAPRNLSAPIQQQLIAQLRLSPTQNITFVVYPGNPESDNLFRQIAWVFEQIHWKFAFSAPMGGSLKGVRVEYDGDNKDVTAIAKLIVTSLRSSDIETQTSSTLPDFMSKFGAYSSNGDVNAGKIRIVVGAK